MRTRVCMSWLRISVLAAGLGLLCAGAAPATTFTLFHETFDGYSHFPSYIPAGDPVNVGLPNPGEGSDEVWYAARFEQANNYCSGGSLDCELAVQQYGDGPSGPNPTPVGRFEDDAGLLFTIDTTGFTEVTLEFDWRTFSTSTSDEVVVGYFVGEIPASEFNSFMAADFRTDPQFSWPNWTEILRDSKQSPHKSESFVLPDLDDAGEVWIAFWLDNGEGDYGKIDNIKVTAVPEPGTLPLIALGLVALARRRR